MRVYILRHGQTDKNKEKVLQGRSDLPLNEEGRRQAEETGIYFRQNGIAFDRVYHFGKSTTPDRPDQTWVNCLNLFVAGYTV